MKGGLCREPKDCITLLGEGGIFSYDVDALDGECFCDDGYELDPTTNKCIAKVDCPTCCPLNQFRNSTGGCESPETC